jgi:hypothetical protein
MRQTCLAPISYAHSMCSPLSLLKRDGTLQMHGLMYLNLVEMQPGNHPSSVISGLRDLPLHGEFYAITKK